MRKPAFRVLLFAVALWAGPVTANAEAPQNLLGLGALEDTTGRVSEDWRSQVAHLIDADPTTIATFQTNNGEPVDLLFAFAAGTIAPEGFSLHLAVDGSEPAPARIDLLASTSSASSGFTSLRTERVDPLKPRQNVRFGGAAANWLLVRLFPAEGATHVALAGLSIAGKEGFPETNYAFGETPAEALEIVSAMKGIGAADLALTPTEEAIFATAAAGELSTSEFIEIALLASGVTEVSARSNYLAEIETLTNEAKSVLAPNTRPEDAGSQLLVWLHERVFVGGYREQQTNLSTVLDGGVFNCVSSAVLYNAIASGLGFDVRAIEVPDHAFSIMYDGLNHMDIETTTAHGFNPRRDKVAEFENLTGFRYIPQSNKSKRREIDAAGLAALIYYNHGVIHLKEGRYQEALFANFRAMSLDPEFASAATNALAALGRWSKTLADEGNWQDATEVAAVGARLAPEDRGLASARKAIWQRWAFSEADAGRHEVALAILTKAAREVDADTFDRMRSAVLIRPAEALIKIGDWEAALDLTANATGLLDGDALADLQEWRNGVYERWAYDHMDDGRFRDALEVLVAGQNAYAGDRDFAHAARYLAQEWARAEGFPKGLTVFADLNLALPQVSDIDETAEIFVRRHVSDGMAGRGLEEALADVQTAANYVTPETAKSLIAYVYEAYGHASIDARKWELAADIYAAGRAAVPDSKILSRNARYVAQEWQRQASAQGGVAALHEVQRKLRRLFPEFAVDPGFGEDEIVRQINSALRSDDTAVALETLATAQLLIRPETYRKLQTVIADHQARKAMEAGTWAKAARIYYDARLQIGDPKLFSRNIAYIAQEWTRVAAATDGATGIATVMEELRSLFPDDKKVGGMGVATLERMIAQHVEAGAFDAAEDIVRQARRVLSGEEARELLVALYARAGSKAIDDAHWEAALTAYSAGLALAPDARDLSRNVPFVFQEWSRTALEQGGAPLLVSEIARMEEILPRTKSLPDVLENVLGRAASAQLDRADPEGALALINDVSIALPDEVTAKLRAVTYDRWAKTKLDAEQWQEAIEIYDMGLLDVPDSSLLKNNRRYAESKL